MLFALFGFLLATVGATDYVYQGFTAANLACGTDSGALNVGLSKPTGVSKFKINQIAFAYAKATGVITAKIKNEDGVVVTGTVCDLIP